MKVATLHPNAESVLVLVNRSRRVQDRHGGALAFEFGVLGIEGRLDATDVRLAFTGARCNLRGTAPPFDGLTASVTLADGRFDADRIPLLSVNARIRTPGPVALVASGGPFGSIPSS